VWRKTTRGRIGSELPQSSARQKTATATVVAQPISTDRPTSPWITAPADALAAIQRAIGPSAYRAYAGACTWLSGVFWLEIVGQRPDGLLIVRNLHDEGTVSIPPVEAVVEPDLIYPLLRGRDVRRWQATPSGYMLLTQDPRTRTGYGESWMKVHLPHTYAYLQGFRQQLQRRSGYKRYLNPKKDPFYTIYNVSEHTLAPYRVFWPEVGHTVEVGLPGAVVDPFLGSKVPVPDHTVIYVPAGSVTEAAYVAALLSSAPAQLVVKGYVTLHPSPHVLEHVAIQKYDPAIELHRRLADLGGAAHGLAVREDGDPSELRQVEDGIDRCAAALWGIGDNGLTSIRVGIGSLSAWPESTVVAVENR
jgi:hypothetical protein